MTPPAGYTALGRGARRAVIRDDLVPVLGPWLLAAQFGPPPGATAIDGGRGAAFRVPVGDGQSGVVRFGRRGGFVARFVREAYAGLRPRPWRELSVTVAARGRGAPVPEVLAGCVHGWLVYRSAIVTVEVAEATTAMAALTASSDGPARCAVARRAGVAVARLHDAGVAHADLNLTNVLVSPQTCAIVDLDRARLAAGRLGRRARARSLRRLRRSARRLDPQGRVVGADVVRAFHEGYREGDPCAS
jgi:3-deoxy-D-manno-octulosonic acid kinase